MSANKKYPVLAFVGYGRAGKDTAAEWFRDNTPLRYAGGCSWTARHYMAEKLGVSPEEAYRRRHENVEMRQLWYEELNKYREKDAARLIRDCLEHSDIVAGVRDREELFAAKREGLLDLIVWIKRDVPVDPTVTYVETDCDCTIHNSSDLSSFYSKLASLAKTLKLLN